MATNTDKIDDLGKLVAKLNERLDNVRAEVESLDKTHVSHHDELQALRRQTERMEERLNELKRVVEESSRRAWSVVPNLLSAGVVALAMLIRYLATGQP